MKSFLVLTALIVIAGIFHPGLAYAATYYVDSVAGNDNNSGTTQSAPWKTLSKISNTFAAGDFNPGDNILLKRGSVWNITADKTTALTLKGSSGTAGQPITIADYGAGPLPRILSTGFISLELDAADEYLIGRLFSDPRADYITLRNLELDKSGGRRQISMANVTNWTLENMYLHGAEKLIDPNNPSATSVAAISPRNNSQRIIIRNSRFEDSQGEALKVASVNSLTDLTGEIVIINSIFKNNAYEGLDMRDGATALFIYNTSFINNGDGGNNTGDTKQISVGGQQHYFYRCRVEGTDPGNITGMQLGRYGDDDTYSGRNNTVERCLFKDLTGGRSIQFEHNDNQVLNSTFVNVSPVLVQGSADNGLYKYNIFSGYTGNMFTINGGTTVIDRNGFTGATQGTNPFTGSPNFANTTNFDLSSNSPYRNLTANGEDLGWSEFGWTETDYRQEFLSFVQSNYSASLSSFVADAVNNTPVGPTPTAATPTSSPTSAPPSPTPTSDPLSQTIEVENCAQNTLPQITTPFTTETASGRTYIFQTVNNFSPASSGSAVCQVTLAQRGIYRMQGQVDAFNGNFNSFFLNFDSNPISPDMIWSIENVTTGFETRDVTWQITSGGVPHDFPLSPGSHSLILRGREASTKLDKLTLTLNQLLNIADLDFSGLVDSEDYNILLSDFSKNSTNSDLTQNGNTDLYDFNVLVSNFGNSQ